MRHTLLRLSFGTRRTGWLTLDCLPTLDVTVSTVNGAGAAAATTATTAAAEETTTLRVVGQEDTATRPNTVYVHAPLARVA